MINELSPARKSIRNFENTIASKIFIMRGQKVLLDFDLATLYQIENRILKQQVRRSLDRFPTDFMFELTKEEWTKLITNSDNLAQKSKFSPRPPMAFTEQGVAMLSSVLRSPKAIKINIEIMRVFVELRKLVDSNKSLAYKLEQLEAKYDKQFKIVFDAIRELMEPPKPAKKQLGFKI